MSRDVPDLNFDTHLSIDDWKYKSNQDEKLLLDRTLLVNGGLSQLPARYGIVDSIDPKNVTVDDLGRPLLVSSSDTGNFRIDVTAGTAVCPNGTIVTLLSGITEFELTRTNDGDEIVVFVENEIVEQEPTRVTKYGTPQKVRRAQSENILRSVLLSQFNSSSFFNIDRKKNIVVLALIRVIDQTLEIDLNNNEIPFNRPWYSPVDIEHRSAVGSGIVTTQNPHGLAFDNLTSGFFNFGDLINRTGAIIAKDRDVVGMPGTFCEETIEPSRIFTDVNGDITQDSKFGKPGAKYINLARVPSNISSFHLNSHKSRAIAYEWIPGTRTIVIPDAEVFSSKALIRYSRVFAAELPESFTSNSIVYNQPDEENEIMYSGGLSYSRLINPSISFEGYGPVPREFKVYLNENGDLISLPQLIVRTTLLNNIGSSFQPLNSSQFGPAQISVGLSDATPGQNLNVTVRLFGRDENDVTITEDLSFMSDWQSITLPSSPKDSNLRRTTKIFKEVSGYQVIRRENDGSASKLLVYAEIESGIANNLNNLLPISTLVWNGQAIVDPIDIRKFVTGLAENKDNKFNEIGYSLMDNTTWVLSEDFSYPQVYSTIPGTQKATNANSFLTFSTDIQAGDTVLINSITNKTITSVSGTPNRGVGEYQIGASAEDTRNDALLTINNTTFNSGIIASTDGVSQNSQLKVEHTVSGSRGNTAIIINTALANAITKTSDYIEGFDSYGEISWGHHQKRLDVNIPSASQYNVTSIRNRYLSNPIPLEPTNEVRVFLHGIKPALGNVQLRFRVAYGTLDYQPWEVLSPGGPWAVINKAQNFTKIQLELFGKLDGYSLFEV